MSDEQFKKAKELQEKLNAKSREIYHIGILLESNPCGLSCKVSATARGRFSPTEYISSNKEFIHSLLKNDMDRLQSEYNELQNEFNKL